jgi:hypothetical protein
MSFMDTIRSWFGKAEDKVHAHGHDHGHDHAHEETAAPPEAAMPPSSAPGTMPSAGAADEEPPQSA